MDGSVRKKFNTYPENVQNKMEELRNLIFETAKNTEGVGRIEETLKWGEPSYITSKPKSGTTVRIDWKESNPDKIGMYVNCQTNLVDNYRSLFDGELEFEGTRAVYFPADKPIPEKQLSICIKMALRYHLDKNKM